MKKSRVWIALGMTVVLCTASAAGAVVMDNSKVAVSSAESEASDVEESVTVLTKSVESEVPETEAEAESEVPETEAEAESEVPETEAEAESEVSETEAEVESETEIESETEEEEEVEKYTAVSYEDEDPWSQVAITNSEYVESGLVIRSEPNLDSEVLGYLYKDTVVWVIERGETWTEFYSNGITGYVMTHYLLFGADVQEIAEVYGAEGVRAEWDDVNIYTSDDAATVLDTMDAGDVYQVVNDYGHWIEIQYEEDTTAYVSSEDVTSVMLFESATPKDGERVELVKFYGVTYASNTDTYSEDEETYTESSSSDSSSSSSSSSTTQTEAPQTETTASGETEQTETSSSNSSSGSSSEGGYYGTDTGTWYDESEDVISTASDASETTYTEETVYTEAETSAYVETEAETAYTYTETEAETAYTYTETEAETAYTYTETEAETTYTYTETEAETAYTYTETEAETSNTYAETEATTSTQTESTSSGTTASTDDVTLLASLIYCEAGNQSYEGMVAVGAVVINRVNSTSFPNTISEVIYQRGQFSPASSGVLARALANGVPSTCYEAAAAAIAGEDPTGGALYFNTTANKGIKIGDHWFY